MVIEPTITTSSIFMRVHFFTMKIEEELFFCCAVGDSYTMSLAYRQLLRL